MSKPPTPDLSTILEAKQSGAQWIRYDCKHWILDNLVWKIFRVVNGLKQQAYIGYGPVDWIESKDEEWEERLDGIAPIGGLEV